MKKTNKKRLLITGGSGMVGHAVFKHASPEKYDIFTLSSKDCNLLNKNKVKKTFKEIKPNYIIHLAAKVGGVRANIDYVADFYTENVLINTNVLEQAYNTNVEKLVSLLSTCIYPDKKWVTYPLTEEQLHLGPPDESNFGYAYAKRMLEVQSRAYNKQYNTKFLCAIPNNIMGEHDNFDLKNGHVVAAVIRKIWEAKINNENPTFWGDGTPLREFTYSGDIARALLFILENVNNTDQIYNIGNTQEISIKSLVDKIINTFKYEGNIVWDANMPKGQHRKPSDNSKFMNISNFQYTNIDKALEKICNWFKASYPNVRGM